MCVYAGHVRGTLRAGMTQRMHIVCMFSACFSSGAHSLTRCLLLLLLLCSMSGRPSPTKQVGD